MESRFWHADRTTKVDSGGSRFMKHGSDLHPFDSTVQGIVMPNVAIVLPDRGFREVSPNLVVPADSFLVRGRDTLR